MQLHPDTKPNPLSILFYFVKSIFRRSQTLHHLLNHLLKNQALAASEILFLTLKDRLYLVIIKNNMWLYSERCTCPNHHHWSAILLDLSVLQSYSTFLISPNKTQMQALQSIFPFLNQNIVLSLHRQYKYTLYLQKTKGRWKRSSSKNYHSPQVQTG